MAQSDTAVSDAGTEDLGGKPNPGTKKDKRLQENDPNKKKKSEGEAERFTAEWFEENDLDPHDMPGALQWVREHDAVWVNADSVELASTPSTDVTKTWSGVICVEGIESGDTREFAEGVLTWADPPIPLRWKKEDSHGGVNDVTVAVGIITAIRREGQNIYGEGAFDMGQPDGAEAQRRVSEGMLSGISIDADDITDADVELIWPDKGPADTTNEDDMLQALFAQPEKILFHAGRIRAATLVDIPAFVEAKIALDASVMVPDATLVASCVDLDAALREEIGDTILASVAAGVDASAPPAAWFANPKLSVPMNIIVTDEGRVYGHAAHWSECHIGHPDMCVTAPYEDSHPYFMTGEMVCNDGTRVSVGQITLGTGHAPLAYNASRAAEHYDNTGSCVADVCVGNDEHGIWVAGAVRPDVDPKRIRDLRAAGKVSGDWRRTGGQMRLVGLLGVNVAGFMTPQVKSRVASGKQLALVAAGQTHVGGSNLDLEKQAFRMVMDRLAQRIKE